MQETTYGCRLSAPILEKSCEKHLQILKESGTWMLKVFRKSKKQNAAKVKNHF